MTEIEKIAYAKTFLDDLARGVNPLDGTDLPESDVVNNVRVSRCLFFVSDVLRQVIENGGTARRSRRAELSLTPEQLAAFPYSDQPIKVSEIVARIKSLAPDENVRFSAVRITNWLLSIGALREEAAGYSKKTRVPTQTGKDLGLIGEDRTNMRGEPYCLILYSRRAQEFLIDNFEAILNA